MLTLITGQKDFDALVGSTNWHSSYIKEMHFENSQYENPNSESRSTVCGEESLVRLLIALPGDAHALEIVAFNIESCSLWTHQDLDEGEKTAIIQRRVIQVNFGAFSLTCACMGFRRLEISALGRTGFYNKESLYNEDGDFVEPYNMDWRSALDESFRPR